MKKSPYKFSYGGTSSSLWQLTVAAAYLTSTWQSGRRIFAVRGLLDSRNFRHAMDDLLVQPLPEQGIPGLRQCTSRKRLFDHVIMFRIRPSSQVI